MVGGWEVLALSCLSDSFTSPQSFSILAFVFSRVQGCVECNMYEWDSADPHGRLRIPRS